MYKKKKETLDNLIALTELKNEANRIFFSYRKYIFLYSRKKKLRKKKGKSTIFISKYLYNRSSQFSNGEKMFQMKAIIIN